MTEMTRFYQEFPEKITQAQRDSLDVLTFLKKFPTKEFSRAQIARGAGLPLEGRRVGLAVCLARDVAARDGDRVEHYRKSKDPMQRGAYTLRFMPKGKGDKDGVHDALRSSRAGITAMEDMKQASRFESKNAHSISPSGFAKVANVVDGCLTSIEGIQELNEQLWNAAAEKSALARRVAELEARQAELEAELRAKPMPAKPESGQSPG